MARATQVEPVRIGSGADATEGMLWLPQEHVGVVVFINGGKRVNQPNDYVATMLRNARLGTLWVDLRSNGEPASWQSPAIERLSDRLHAVCDWLRQHDAACNLPIGLLGSSYGTAAALQLAAAKECGISALVLRGGRPDLAMHGVLTEISAPTLLIVGGLDDGVLQTNRAVYAALRCKKRIEIIPGATHTFEEPGSLEVVARLARGWFLQHTDVAYA